MYIFEYGNILHKDCYLLNYTSINNLTLYTMVGKQSYSFMVLIYT